MQKNKKDTEGTSESSGDTDAEENTQARQKKHRQQPQPRPAAAAAVSGPPVATEFVASEYITGEVRQVQDESGSWRQALLYRSRDDRRVVVLWYGGDEYEGIGSRYTYRGKVLRDGDGDLLPSKAVKGKRGIDRELRQHMVVGDRDPLDSTGGSSSDSEGSGSESEGSYVPYADAR